LKGIRWLIREDYPKALEAYVEAIELGEPDPEIYQQAVALAQEAGEQELGLALLEEMVDVFFLNRGVMRFAAYMYGQWAQWEDCAALAEEAAQMESDPELVIGLYELGANAYFRMDDVFEGSRLYDAALAVDSNASVLNNYAWELAQAEEQLEKALVLTTMSNAKKPLEATFLDTWAWVLYKMNRYAEAQAKIEVALQLSRTSPDPVLFQHAARIAQALGEDGKAAEYRVKASALQGR
jgi:tetratricopeptide (TPR) repeat protein